jgi:hypothetical protein
MMNPDKPFWGLLLIIKRKRGRPPILDASADIHVLTRLLYDKSREHWGLGLIASEIEQNALNDERLRKDLADMFSRTTEGPLGMKFDVARLGSRKPRSEKKLRAHNFLELHADIFGEKTTEVVAAAARIYGLHEGTARKYLQLRRRLRRNDAFWSNAFERDIALSMREKGYQEYQPLKDILKTLNNIPCRIYQACEYWGIPLRTKKDAQYVLPLR